jgi:hypothetical protein
VAQTLIRIAAGLAIAATITVSGGLGPAVASADHGGPRSPSGHSRDGGHSRGDGDRQRDHGRGSRDGDRGEHRRQDPRRAGAPGVEDRRGGVDRSPAVVAGRGASSPSVAEPTLTSRVAAVQPAASDPVPEVASRPTVPSGRRSSVSDGAREAMGLPPGASGATGMVPGDRDARGTVSVPRVTFGDGRLPGYWSVRLDGPPSASSADPAIGLPVPAAPAPAPPVFGPPAPAPLPPPSPEPTYVQPVEWAPDTPVTSLWGRVQPDWPAGLIFGIAGLLLAPLGGIWLGHRQARASRTASELVSH